ncbi:alginate export family protein [Paraglaciecola aquimarina]|uniref:Alginate export family protein n=1 Tax=Paraglaciecola aquimarina TaxID=1235557 RepID=A0ABU3SXW6_9ALTE|nr:alginate export family protein [Paraglaciecola aquimarina]MDU0354848.1 alginate export family protein [Paraglaciecola aquimarina]
MKIFKKTPLTLALSVAIVGLSVSNVTQAESITEALTSGKASVNNLLRYESVEQDNAAKDASALTLRTLLAYKTGTIKGFSATVEMEDSRIVMGQGDYTVGPTGYNVGEYSVIADPEHTELDQGFIQYTGSGLTAKLGRQVITMDGHRFIGHVGWRQDRQTFDGLSVRYAPSEALTLNYAYIDQRNRIFAESADLDAKDHLLNASYMTPVGKITAYGYLLEVDNGTENSLDTYGVSFTGSTAAGDAKILYAAEYASQSNETSTTDFSTDYMNLSVGVVVSGITAKLGYESLGSDEGGVGFATPLATLHKFNGWADMFLGTPNEGLVDTSVTLAGKVLGGSWTVMYHDFEADEATATVDDLGSELDLSYVKSYGKHYSAGIKYAAYSGEGTRVDTDKLWVWVGAKF